MAIPDSTGAGKQSCWTKIITQFPNRKTWHVRGYCHSINQLQTSSTPPLPRKNVQHACCTLYSMPSLHTVWCSNFACCCATPRHLHNANANRALGHTCRTLYPQYRNVSAVVNLWVVGEGGGRCQTSRTISMVLYGTVM